MRSSAYEGCQVREGRRAGFLFECFGGWPGGAQRLRRRQGRLGRGREGVQS